MAKEKRIENKMIFALPLTMLLAMASFGVAFLLAGMGPGQKQIFMTGDLYMQYAALNRLFWRNLLHGEKLTYSFFLGLGMPTNYSFSPIHILFALVEDADLAAFLIIMIKIGLSAGAFYLYARKSLKTEKYIAATFGICYAMCGFVIGSICQISHLDANYLLPVLILLIERAIKSGRYFWLTPIYAFCFISCLYTGYMLGVFSAVYYVSFLFSRKGIHWKQVLWHMGRFTIAVLLALLISAGVAVPILWYIFSNRAEDATGWHKLSFQIWDLTVNFFMGQFQGYSGDVPLVYSGVGTLITAVAAGVRGKHNDWTNPGKVFGLVPMFFLLLCIFVKPFYMMIHCFDMPDSFEFRFTFMLSFLLLVWGAREAGQDGNLRRNLIIASILGLFCVFAYGLVKCTESAAISDGGPENVVVTLLFLYLWAILLGMNKRKCVAVRMAIVGLACIEMTANAYLMHTPDDESHSRKREYYEMWMKEGSAVAQGLLQDKENAGAFRVYYENPVFADDSAFFGYRGLGYFSSVEQPALRKALSGLGYAASTRVVCDYGSTPVTRMLFAQRYLVHGVDLRYETEESFAIMKNRYALPMAYMVSDRLYDYVSGDNPFENQDQVLRLMRGDTGAQVYYPVSEEITVKEEGIHLTEMEGEINLTKEPDVETGKITYCIPYEGENLYAYFVPAIQGWWNESALLVSEQTDTGMVGWDSTLSFAHILPLGRDTEGRYECSVYMLQNSVTKQSYRQAYFAAFDTDAFINNYENLTVGSAVINAISEGKMQCEVSATAERPLLFTGIPYDEGWSVWVDGQTVEKTAVLEEAFIAIPLEPGQHEVLMEYRAPGLHVGIILSIIGGILLLIWGIYQKRYNYENNK